MMTAGGELDVKHKSRNAAPRVTSGYQAANLGLRRWACEGAKRDNFAKMWKRRDLAACQALLRLAGP